MSIQHTCPICGKSVEPLYRYASTEAMEIIANYKELAIPQDSEDYEEIICDRCFYDFEKEIVEYITVCNSCNTIITADEAVIDVKGNSVCSDCLDNDYFYCGHCDNYYNLVDNKYITTENDDIYCEDCAERYCYQCDNCGSWFSFEELQRVVIDDDSLCLNCYYNIATSCSNCGDYIYETDAVYINEDPYCASCASERAEEDEDDSGYIHSYKYKPDLKFIKSEKDTANSPLFFGIELEFHNRSNSIKNEVIDTLHSAFIRNSPFYMKEDGSLDYGIELVSHPHTLRAWQDTIKKGCYGPILTYLQISHDKNMSYIDSNSGIHIHTTKKGMSDCHKIRYNAFIYKNSDFIEQLAQRKGNSYCKYKTINKDNFRFPDNIDRYEAVNWVNSSTVELRMFKSSFNPFNLLVYVEFCHALYLFTKWNVNFNQILKDDSLMLFDTYVTEKNKIYPHLYRYLAGKQLLSTY